MQNPSCPLATAFSFPVFEPICLKGLENIKITLYRYTGRPFTAANDTETAVVIFSGSFGKHENQHSWKNS